MIPKKRATIILITAVMIATVVSLTPLAYRLADKPDRPRPIAGEIVSVTESVIVIKDRHGKEFTLQIASTTKSGIPVGEVLTPGMDIQAFGTPDDSGVFVLSHIRPLKVPKL